MHSNKQLLFQINNETQQFESQEKLNQNSTQQW